MFFPNLPYNIKSKVDSYCKAKNYWHSAFYYKELVFALTIYIPKEDISGSEKKKIIAAAWKKIFPKSIYPYNCTCIDVVLQKDAPFFIQIANSKAKPIDLTIRWREPETNTSVQQFLKELEAAKE